MKTVILVSRANMKNREEAHFGLYVNMTTVNADELAVIETLVIKHVMEKELIYIDYLSTSFEARLVAAGVRVVRGYSHFYGNADKDAYC